MPHLSPMNWLIAPIMFMMISLPLLISYMWWAQSPNFPKIISNSEKVQANWDWN